MNFEFQIDFSSSDSFQREGRSACTMRRAARQKNEPLTQSDLWACARRRPRPPRRAHRAPWEKWLSWSERGASARASTPFCNHGITEFFRKQLLCACAHISQPDWQIPNQIRATGNPLWKFLEFQCTWNFPWISVFYPWNANPLTAWHASCSCSESFCHGVECRT